MISICIPLYNKEKYIKRCINSILNQTYKDFEVIIVDDCSTDNSVFLIPKDNRIKIYHNNKNIGCGGNRLKTIQLASGDYYCFIDADDWIEPNYLQTLYNAIQDCDIVITNHNINKTTNNKETLSILNKALYNYTCWGKLFTKEIIKSYPYHNSRYAEDIFTIPNWINNAKIIKFIDYKGYNYKVNNNSISIHKNAQNFTDGIISIYELAKVCLINKAYYEFYCNLQRILNAYINIIVKYKRPDFLNDKVFHIVASVKKIINQIEYNNKSCLNKQII